MLHFVGIVIYSRIACSISSFITCCLKIFIVNTLFITGHLRVISSPLPCTRTWFLWCSCNKNSRIPATLNLCQFLLTGSSSTITCIPAASASWSPLGAPEGWKLPLNFVYTCNIKETSTESRIVFLVVYIVSLRSTYCIGSFCI